MSDPDWEVEYKKLLAEFEKGTDEIALGIKEIGQDLKTVRGTLTRIMKELDSEIKTFLTVDEKKPGPK
jgi:hypothetical protein